MNLIRLAFASMLLAQPAAAVTLGPYTDLVVFGDSLSDPGNAVLVAPGSVPAEVYPNGQLTNGDVWAVQLGTKPALIGGTNYAFGGARATGEGASPGFETQRDQFLASAPPLGDRPLVAVWLGGNDLRDAFGAVDPNDPSTAAAIPDTIAAAVGAIATGLVELSGAGLKDFLVFGQVDLGRLPGIVGTPFEPAASAASQAFNLALQAQVLALDGPSRRIDYFDVAATFDDLISRSDEFGIETLTVPCLLDPGDVRPETFCGVEQGDTFLFYDPVHPSEPPHSFLANAVAASVAPVPLPAGLWLLLAALGSLGYLRHAALRG